MRFRGWRRMSKRISKEVLPAVRFPEFRSKGAWLLFKLEDVAEFYKGKGLPKSAICDNGELQCIHYGELFTAYSEVINSVKNRTNQESNFISKPNDVLMPTSDITPNGLAKASSLNIGGVVLGGDILIIRTNGSEVNGEFLSRFIRKEENQVLKFVTGSTVYHLYGSSLGKLILSKPEFQEQQKIADCLSSIDELITAHTQKLEALKAHKKGLMQQLFPAEGETVPKLRFPEFRGEWHKNTLKDICKINQGLQIPISKRFTEKVEGSYFYITNEFLKAGAKNTYYIKNPTDSVICGKSDILMTRTGNTGQVVTGVEGAFHNNFFKIKYIDNVVKEFLVFFLRSNRTQREILTLAGASTIPDLNHNDFYKIEISLPCQSEQQKIADCLISVDEFIISQSQKIESLKVHKKGLMQQLFPSIDGAGV